MKTYTDEQLVTNYLKGDEKALEVLIKRYLKPIYSFTFRFVGNPQEAEDITQEAFVKAWRKLKKFNSGRGNFKTWIFTIAKNTCLDWQKKKRAVPFSVLDNEDKGFSFTEVIKDSASLPNELLEKQDVTITLNKAIKSLSPRYRMVLFLRYNEHFTFREIGEVLEESINTVKSRHRRGIVLLKKLLT